MDATETTVEGTADARMMNGSALSEERRPQVFFHWQAVKRRPRELIRSFHEALAVVVAQAEDILVGKALHRVERPLAAKRIKKLEQRILALAADDIIHVARVQRRVRVDGREVAPPTDGDFRMK